MSKVRYRNVYSSGYIGEAICYSREEADLAVGWSDSFYAEHGKRIGVWIIRMKGEK